MISPVAAAGNCATSASPDGTRMAIRALSLGALVFVAIYIAGLSALFGRPNGWLIDETGLPRSNEYVSVRAAGALALKGRAGAAYDWTAHEEQTAAVIGRPVKIYVFYAFPPTFSMFAAILALPPFLWSALLSIAATMALYAWAVAHIARARIAALWAVASPAVVFNTFVAHTAFWSAALTGLALQALPKRPVLAGALLGILTMKPQLGLLVPVALLAGGYWRAIAAAAFTTAGLGLLSVALFGPEAWFAFAKQLSVTSEAVRLGHPRTNDVNMNLLASAYGCLRSLGVADGIALTVQTALAVALAASVAVVWRARLPYALQAAWLASASLLATPYLFVYDLTHLSIAIAFLVQHTGLAGLRREEVLILAGAIAMTFLVFILLLPFAFVGNAFVGIIIASRVWPLLSDKNGAHQSLPEPIAVTGR